MEEQKKRPLLGPLELTMLILGLAIIAYVTLQSGGGKVMERTETIKILDQPNGPKEKARRYNADNDESVEALLHNLAEQYSEESKNGSSTKKAKATKSVKAPEQSQVAMSSDEKKYYEGVREKASFREQIETARDWYNILSTSQKTYSKVKEIFGEASRQPEEKVNPNNLSEQLKNTRSSADFYKKLSETFQIDPKDIEAFGRTGQRALSDWAEFVESESKK